MRLLFVATVLLLSLATASAGCEQGNVTSVDAAADSSANEPVSASDARADGKDAATSDADANAPCSCPSGLGCNAAGACVACTKVCGANGACVVGWEGGEHCDCVPGYYETLGGCRPAAGSACDGITCSGHGTCFAQPQLFLPECHCEGDFVAYDLACAPLHKLRCIDADGSVKDKGTIRCNAANTTFEVCRDGNADGNLEWVPGGTPSCAVGATCTQCLGAKCDSGDGTGGQACPTGTICMGTVHEFPVYQCKTACDCTNCGTCDPGQFTGHQRACGSSADSFENPTKACASPCPRAGDGCLPFGSLSFCFPSEGCASAAPK